MKVGVYILRIPHEDNLYKIGCSANLNSRLKSGDYRTTFLPNNLPELMHVFYFKECDNTLSGIKYFEDIIHNILEEHRIVKVRELFKIENLGEKMFYVINQLNNKGIQYVIFNKLEDVPDIVVEKVVEKVVERNVMKTRGKYRCNKCKKVFKTKANLINHLSNRRYPCDKYQPIDVNGKKKFKCLECGKLYTKKQNLVKHMKKRHGIKQDIKNSNKFLCDNCKKFFSTKHNMNVHYKKCITRTVASDVINHTTINTLHKNVVNNANKPTTINNNNTFIIHVGKDLDKEIIETIIKNVIKK